MKPLLPVWDTAFTKWNHGFMSFEGQSTKSWNQGAFGNNWGYQNFSKTMVAIKMGVWLAFFGWSNKKLLHQKQLHLEKKSCLAKPWLWKQLSHQNHGLRNSTPTEAFESNASKHARHAFKYNLNETIVLKIWLPN